ncbi:MAG TPA: DUF2461 domain-containing protein [Dehalococcoidia bacterium]|nr:DUF2461 domain-containing protein [Dehalococcoidia bacterium]
MVSEFTGFAPETFAFLRDLTQHNDRDWFTANRARYEAHYLAPALAFIEAIGPRLAAELPGDVRFEPRVNGSLFRINRDVRFSKDKTPYKNHIDMWFWTGDKKGWETPGYFMRLLPERWAIGAGIHHLSKEGLEAYRRAVLDDAKGRALEAAVARVGGPYEVGLASRKSVPRGYDASHPRAVYLLHEGLVGVLEDTVPPEAGSAGFVETCVSHFKAVSPINEWLASILRR